MDGLDDRHELGELGDGGVDVLLLAFEQLDPRATAVDRRGRSSRESRPS
jgi:hypothetical protein